MLREDNVLVDNPPFVTLAKKFIHYYKLFDTWRQKEGSYDKEKDCYVLFGMTGAGKSTVMVRMCNNEVSPDDFLAILNNKTRPTFTDPVTGITIGHETKATTVIPTIYHVGNLQFCDMPGFLDTEEDVQIIISILQKCLLAMVTGPCRYMVVIESKFLNTPKAAPLLTHYFTSLATLLGGKGEKHEQILNFKNCLSQTFFLLTKRDRLLEAGIGITKASTEAQIQEAMKKIAADCLNHDDERVPSFAKRCATSHVVIDYSMSNRDLMAKITEMIERSANPTRTYIQEQNNAHLDARNEQLNRKCIDELERLEKIREAKLERWRKELLPKITADWNALQTELDRDMMAKVTIDGKVYENPTEGIASFIGEGELLLQQLTAHSDTKILQLKKQIREDEDAIKFYQHQSETINNLPTLPKYETVSVHSFVGRKDGTYKVEIKLDMNPINFRDRGSSIAEDKRVILIINSDRTALMAHIRAKEGVETSDSIVPSRISVIEEFQQDNSVLYNSANPTSARLKVDVTASNELKCQSLSCSHRDKFEVLVYCSTPFVSTPDFCRLKNTCTSELRTLTEQRATRQAELDRTLSQSEKWVEGLPGYTTRAAEVMKVLVRLQSKRASFKERGDTQCDSDEKIRLRVDQALADMEQSSTMNLVSQINEILTRNNLVDTNLGQKCWTVGSALKSSRKELETDKTTLNNLKENWCKCLECWEKKHDECRDSLNKTTGALVLVPPTITDHVGADQGVGS